VGSFCGFCVGLVYAVSILRGGYDPWLVTRRPAFLYPMLEAIFWGVAFLLLAAVFGSFRSAVDHVTRRGIALPAVVLYGSLALGLAFLLFGIRVDVVDTILTRTPYGLKGALVTSFVLVLLLTRIRPTDASPLAINGRRNNAPCLLTLAAGTCLALLAGILLLGETRSVKHKEQARMNVLLITIDALRADSVGCLSDSAPPTPNIDALASKGITFLEAFAQAPWTLPSFASLMTSQYPSEVGVTVVHDAAGISRLPLNETAPTLAEVLQAAGFKTAAQLTCGYVSESFGLQRGFDEYRHNNDSHDAAPFCYRTALRLIPALSTRLRGYAANPRANDADGVTRGAVTWLSQEREEPFFLWVHYLEPHEPYGAPGSYAESGAAYHELVKVAEGGTGEAAQEARTELRDLYKAEVSYCDRWIGDLLRAIDRLHLAERTVVILTADHGEAFWEHGKRGHGWLISDEVLRVPLIIRAPGGISAGRRVERPVRLLDVAPTVLELLGVPVPEQFHGRSLLNTLGSDSLLAEERKVLAECCFIPPEMKGVRASDHWVVYRPDSDSFEDVPEHARRLPMTIESSETMREKLRRWTQRMDRALASGRGEAPELTEEQQDQLKALGYL